MKIIFSIFFFGLLLFSGFFTKEINAATCTVNVLADTGTGTNGAGGTGDLRYCIGQTNINGGAIIRLTNLTTGEQRFASVNPFGFYRFQNVPNGANVRIEVLAKNRTFTPQTVIIAGEINNLNFIARL